MYSYKWPRPILTVDAVILRNQEILLIKRGIEPFKDMYALPGGHVGDNENTKLACIREVKEETNLDVFLPTEIGIFEKPWRDPRTEWVISVAYLFESLGDNLKAGDDAAECKWFNLNELPELAFDHQQIIERALVKARYC